MTNSDLHETTLRWSRPWWDADQHMVWNPPGSLDEHKLPARSLHLVPNTAWLAYAFLASDDPKDRSEGAKAIQKLISLQYDEEGTLFHGTYAMFLEWPHPPSSPTMWEDYDPNWRQFVGTTLALILELFSDRLDAALVVATEDSIALACEGETDGRIPPTYSNPALMRAWLDAWLGKRRTIPSATARGEDFARQIVAEFDKFGAFEEFNSPTYYGIDLLALNLWKSYPPTELFQSEGARLEQAVWRSTSDFFNPTLHNFCGPFTRSYNPDATTSVTVLSLWIWALFGRDTAPLPSLDAEYIDHCHDLMAGPVIAGLAASSPAALTRDQFLHDRSPRFLNQELSNGRSVTASVYADLMLGAESSDNDWGGWAQFIPVTAHWQEGAGIGVLWICEPHLVKARAERRQLEVDASISEEKHTLVLNVRTPHLDVELTSIRTDNIQIDLGGDACTIRANPIGPGLHRVELTPDAHASERLRITMTFEHR